MKSVKIILIVGDKMKMNLYRKTLAKTMKSIRKFDLVQLNEPVIFEEPVIFVLNHSSMHDVPVAIEYLKRQFTLLAGKENLDLLAKILFRLNGVEFVDRKDKKSKHSAKERLIRHSFRGHNVLMFIEGTWNLTATKVMLPPHWGVVDIAKTTKKPVVPIVLEYTMDTCYVKMGKPIYISDMVSKEDGIFEIASALGNLRWDVWEHIGIQKREDVTEEDFQAYVDMRLKEYPKFNRKFEKSIIRNNGEELVETPKEINERIHIDSNNAFLLRKDFFYSEEELERSKQFTKRKNDKK